MNKYNKTWETDRPWCRPVFGDVHSFNCTYCKSSVSVKAKGVTAVKNHADTDKHKKNASGYGKKQAEFEPDGSLNVKELKDYLTPQDLIVRAELIEAMNSVECNRSFQSANKDSIRYKKIFPGHPVAEGYSQGETKMKYNIQFGLAPYIKAKLISDCVNKPFVFLFDETTTGQTKKQYDGYVRYESPITSNIETHYCGSMFVGHCTAKDLVDHFFAFMKDLGLDLDFLINLGMDGPNVNKKFNNNVKKELDAKDTSFLDIGSCNLHAANNSFGKAIDLFKRSEIIDLDQFAIDLHSFFKLSAARKEDYSKIAELTDLTATYMMKHVQTRWLSIEKVLVRIMQQWENLKVYFLETVPKQKNFKKDHLTSKPGIPNRYQRIVNLLQSKETVAYMGLVVYTASPFKRFLLTFQTNEPMIHILYDEMTRLLHSLLRMFIDTKDIPNKRSELVEFDCTDERFHLAKCDVGTRASAEVVKHLDALKAKQFYDNAKKFLICFTDYLLEHLPLDEQILLDVRVLHPINQSMKNGPNAIKRLSENVLKVLGKKVNDHFKFVGEKYQLIDLVVKEFGEYTLHLIPESLYKKEELPAKEGSSRNQQSYWAEAFKEAGVENIKSVASNYKRIDNYWASVGALLDSSGKRLFPHLSILARCLLLLTHGNADPERGFSINKNLLDCHGATIDEKTIIALRLVKDFILHNNGGSDNVVITKEMISYSKTAWSRFDMYLQKEKEEERLLKKKQEEEAAAEKEQEKENELKKKKSEKKKAILSDIEMWETKLEMAEKLIVSANDEMHKLVNSGKLVKKDLQLCQAKTEMALKRKGECDTEICDLKKKLSKLS